MIKIGCAGIGGVKEADHNLVEYKEKGLDAAEVAYTYGVYFKSDAAKNVGEVVKKIKLELSIHGPYYVNLNSDDKKKIEQSKKRILDCCESACYLKAKKVVFHPGFYGKIDAEKTYQNIKKNVQDLIDYIKDKRWDVILCPETTGKINVFGSLDEIFRLVKDTKCGFCIDFAHLKARNKGKLDLKDVLDRIKKFRDVHCHYSGIAYGDKGERHHKNVNIREWKELANNLKKVDTNFTIICESPDPFKDALKMKSAL